MTDYYIQHGFEPMRFLSLFAGIGGFDLGLERAGMQCVGQVEIDPKCQLVLAKHWPHVKRIGDIRNVKGNEFGTVDLICGGFPCQPFSCAGKRKGKADDRYLWPEMLRVTELYKPSWFVGENVAGIVSLALDQVCSDLESIGYEVQPFIIPACGLNAQHRRDRVWILAYSQSNRDKRITGTMGGTQKRSEEQTNGKFVNCQGETGSGAFTNTFQQGLQGYSRNEPDWNEPGRNTEKESGSATKGDICTDVSDIDNMREPQQEGGKCDQRRWIINSSQDVCHSSITGFPDWAGGEVGQPWPVTEFERSDGNGKVREIERDFCGVAHGVSNRVHRLKQLGNAVVPQIPEIIGRYIIEIERLTND